MEPLPQRLPATLALLITDTLDSPADFLVPKSSSAFVFSTTPTHVSVDISTIDLLSAFRQLEQSQGTDLVVIDSITPLLWFGRPLLDIQRFLRAVRAWCGRNRVPFVVRHHVTGEDDELRSILLKLCSSHLEVLALLSGKSKLAHGNIAVHSTQVESIQRKDPLQFRLTDAGPVYFKRGLV